MENNIVMILCGKCYIEIDDGIFHDVLCVSYFSSNLFSIYQITHSGTGKIVELSRDSVFIRDSETSFIVTTGIVDHSSCLYSFSHFGPPSPLLENHSPSSQESTEVKSGCLNLCVVLETSVVTSTTPLSRFHLLHRITLQHCILLQLLSLSHLL